MDEKNQDVEGAPEDPSAKLCLRYSTEISMCAECCGPQANVGAFGAVAKSCQFHVAPHDHDLVDHEHVAEPNLVRRGPEVLRTRCITFEKPISQDPPTEGLRFPEGRPLTPSEIGVIDGDGSGRCLRCGRQTIAQRPKCVVCKAWPFVCFECSDKLEEEDRSAGAEKAEGSVAELLDTLGFERQESGRLADRVRELESQLDDSERTQEAMAENVRKANAKVLLSRNELMARKVKKAGRDALERRALRTRAREAEARVKDLEKVVGTAQRERDKIWKRVHYLEAEKVEKREKAEEDRGESEARIAELEEGIEGTEAELIRLVDRAEKDEAFWRDRGQKAEAHVEDLKTYRKSQKIHMGQPFFEVRAGDLRHTKQGYEVAAIRWEKVEEPTP